MSISLDVVGSTEIKKQLSEFSFKYNTKLDEHYSDMVKSMLVAMRLLLQLVRQDDVIELKRLYLVKRIGDEFWYAYDLNGLDGEEVTRHSTRLVKVLLSFLLEAPFDVTAFLPDAHIREELCWKCTIDLVEHAVDASLISESELDHYLIGRDAGSAAKGTAALWDEEKLALRNNLGDGFSYISNGEVAYVARRDYIGLEVDRFFRISRDAEKRKILAGKRFLSALMIYTSPVTGKCSFREPVGEESFITALSEVSLTPIEFSEKKLKGIRGGYSGAYIFSEYAEYSDNEDVWG